jgi:hypothetical protein
MCNNCGKDDFDILDERIAQSQCDYLIAIFYTSMILLGGYIGFNFFFGEKPKPAYNSEVSLKEYQQVKETLTEFPEASKIYVEDGLQKDEYFIVMKNGKRMKLEKVKREVKELIN